MLINLKTNLKSLKFGKDKPGGGDSGQPFIKTAIPSTESDPTPSPSSDFILRGGINAPQRALKDVERLSKYLFNPKSPKGALFVAKENLLSRTSPKTEATSGPAYVGGNINAGVYTPLSTLAQAGVGFLGSHLNQKGIDPTGLSPFLSLNKYEDVIKRQTLDFGQDSFQEMNRLVKLTDAVDNRYGVSNFNFIKDYSLNAGNSVITYGGGPGSILGVGKTRINFADQRTGVNNNELRKSNFFKNGFSVFKNPRETTIDYNNLLGASNRVVGEDVNNNINEEGQIIDNPYKEIGSNPIVDKTPDGDSQYLKNPRETSIDYSNLLGASNLYSYTPRASDDPFSPNPSEETITLIDNNINSNGNLIDNTFKEIGSNGIVSPDPDIELNKALSDSSPKPKDDTTYKFDTYKNTRLKELYGGNKDFNKLNIENRVNLGDPGSPTRRASYDTNAEPLDKINASQLYSTTSDRGRNSGEYNDLVSFRIGIIDANNINKTTYMNFRSYIDSFSDSYSSEWKDQEYMGRGEKFYKYGGGFSRDISLGFTIVAQSPQEMRGMYQKLNYLASSLAPTYTYEGYMAGNLVKMTVGDYIYEQYGFISSLTYDIPEDSSWDLSLTPGIEIQRDNKANPDELPLLIKVTGLKFTPIHNFRPELAPNGALLGKDQRFITNGLNLDGYNAKT